MNINIISERCIACGLCQTLSPIFDYDDEGIVIFSDHEEQSTLKLSAKDSSAALEAVKSCPTKALTIS